MGKRNGVACARVSVHRHGVVRVRFVALLLVVQLALQSLGLGQLFRSSAGGGGGGHGAVGRLGWPLAGALALARLPRASAGFGLSAMAGAGFAKAGVGAGQRGRWGRARVYALALLLTFSALPTLARQAALAPLPPDIGGRAAGGGQNLRASSTNVNEAQEQ